MLDHPITQKVLATVSAATIVAIGGAAWQNSRTVNTHDLQIKQIERTQTDVIFELKMELKEIRKDTQGIREDVAVLRERTEHMDEHTRS